MREGAPAFFAFALERCVVSVGNGDLLTRGDLHRLPRLLGDDADSLLNHESQTIARSDSKTSFVPPKPSIPKRSYISWPTLVRA